MAETKHLIPGLFWRLLGFKGGSIDISEKGITLHKDNKSYFIDNHSFVKKGIVERGLLGSKLIFNTTKGKVPFGPLSHSEVKQAYEWFTKSSNQNYNWAQHNLAKMYYNGEYIEKSYPKAIELFKKAAEQDNSDSQNRVGNMYYSGEGVVQNYKQAAYWYQKSAENNFNWIEYWHFFRLYTTKFEKGISREYMKMGVEKLYKLNKKYNRNWKIVDAVPFCVTNPYIGKEVIE
jgi:TPR repeat protein